MLDCLLDDLAYLWGLTCGRGSLNLKQKNLTIDVPFKSVEAIGITKIFNQKDKLIIGLDNITNRLGEFTGKPVQKIALDKSIRISIFFETNNHTWTSLVSFFNGKDSSHSFLIPDDFFTAPARLKLNFLRGFSDVAGFVRKSNYDRAGRYRVYFEIPNVNWHLPIQICRLLQDSDINVPVQTITWGHPNTRGDKNWSKEHQVKVYAEYFENIGFSIGYKNEILKELAEQNIARFGFKDLSYCNPTLKRPPKKKEYHFAVKSDNIPKLIRGRHFDSYWQICSAIGCYKCKK